MRSRIACGLSPVSAFKAIWISPALTVAMSSPPSVFSTVPALEQDLTRRSGSLARAHVLKTGYRNLDPENRPDRKSVAKGKCVSVRVDLEGSRIIKKNKT